MSNAILLRNIAKYGRPIELADRNMKTFNGLPQEVFSNQVIERAITKTVHGVKVFDSQNEERVATHKIILSYVNGITSEKWVKIGLKRVRVLTVENCCERDEVLILMCTERGQDVDS